MATEVVTGTMKLATRILDDARADAKNAEAAAEESAAAIRAENEQKLAGRRAEFAQKREAAVKSVLDGCRTRAELDGRKLALKKKRAVIDEVFAETYQALLALSDGERGKVLSALLAAEAGNGDVIVPASRDRAVIEKLLPGMADAKLTLSPDDAPFQGGFMLVNAGYEKDCSFASLLRDLRDAEETGVARLLFTSEGGQS